MIVEIVSFDLPEGMTRDEVVELFEKSVPRWRANPDLVRKYYLFDGASRTGGGVYLWPDIAAAKTAHDDAWCDMAEKMYGCRPRFRYFEAPLIVDNSAT
jgi:hypothetical protein